MRSAALLLVPLVYLFWTAPVDAQTAQKFSVQGSFLYADLGGADFDVGGDFETEAGSGYEIQIRYNPGALSIGLGYQYTTHPVTVTGLEELIVDDEYAGVFIEPRYVIFIGSDRVAPYASARIMALTNTFSWYDPEFDEFELIESDAWGYTFGGGLLVRIASRINMDAGLTAGAVTLIPELEGDSSLTGFSTVLRLGVAVGVL